MEILLDSDILIEAERGKFDLATWTSSQPQVDFMVSAVTVAELWHGVERATGPYRAARQLYVEMTFAVLKSFPYTDQTARIHARLWSELESSGQMIGAHDVIVAATALEHLAPVATFNIRHFSRIPGLQVITPAVP
jgi:tRNA(fMet)-specific endonuclease VapC